MYECRLLRVKTEGNSRVTPTERKRRMIKERMGPPWEKLLVVEKSKFDSSQARDMDTVELPRARIFLVKMLS